MTLHKEAALLLLGTIIVIIAPATALADDDDDLDISIAKAPIAPDGTTAGAPTDFVITYRDRDPDEDGIAMQNGGTFTVVLPSAFTDNGPAGNNVAVLQGWPQSPRVPFPYTIGIAGNTVTLTMTDDWPVGAFGPGPKQIHLILLGFLNPEKPGRYRIPVSIDPDGPGGEDAIEGVGRVRIIPNARPSVNVVSLFSGPPGPPPPFFNPVYQDVEPDESARQVGLYLWDRDNVPSVGVDLVATGDPTYYLLKKDYGEAVGSVRIDAPDDAEDFSLASVALPPGGPPSVEISAFVTGPALGTTVGLLGVQFTPDPEEDGEYEIKIRMFGGNKETLYVDVGDDDDEEDDND